MRLLTVLYCVVLFTFVNLISAEENVEEETFPYSDNTLLNAIDNTEVILNTEENTQDNSDDQALQNADENSASYLTAAVIEYNPVSKDSSEDTVKENLKNYEHIVNQLKKRYSALKLIVFPEAALHTSKGLQAKDLYAEAVPDPKQKHLKPLFKTEKHTVLGSLSALAHKHKVNLVINFVEKAHNKNKTEIKYNTNVVFDPNGQVVSRYRKIHLFGKVGEPFSTPENQEISEFKVDNVKFGTFTCFDILFKRPPLDLVAKGITHFVFPTAWYSELPYLTAIQEQSAWAYSTNSILLASGYNDPELGSSGSGIYYGNKYAPVSFQTQTQLNYAIVAKIPKKLHSFSGKLERTLVHLTKKSSNKNIDLKLKTEPLDKFTVQKVKDGNYTTVPKTSNLTMMSESDFDEKVCQGDLCCQFTGKMVSLYVFDLVYRSKYLQQGAIGDEFGMNQYNFAVFNGKRNFENIIVGGQQICSIVSCGSSSATSCGNRTDQNSPFSYKHSNYPYIKLGTIFTELKISADFSTNNTFTTSQILLSSRNVKNNNLQMKLFGINADPNTYNIKETKENGKQVFHFNINKHHQILNPASINLYTRVFNLDGVPSGASTIIQSYTLALSLSFIWLLVR